jgi:hypothetical protein
MGGLLAWGGHDPDTCDPEVTMGAFRIAELVNLLYQVHTKR